MPKSNINSLGLQRRLYELCMNRWNDEELAAEITKNFLESNLHLTYEHLLELEVDNNFYIKPKRGKILGVSASLSDKVELAESTPEMVRIYISTKNLKTVFTIEYEA